MKHSYIFSTGQSVKAWQLLTYDLLSMTQLSWKKIFFISKKAQFFSTLSWLNVWFQLCHPPLWFGGVCMADGISELWRVGWRPSAPSITQWWTWEASPWQHGGWAEVGGTNGVKDRAREGSQLPQYGDCKKGWMEKKCPGLRSGIYDGGIRWTMPSLAVCLCEGWGWISWLFVHTLSAVWIIKGAFHHVAIIFCFRTLFYSIGLGKQPCLFSYSSPADVCVRVTAHQCKWWIW